MVMTASMVYTALLVGGYLDPSTYRDLQVITVGAYLAANVHQKHTEAKFNAGDSN